MDLRLDQPIAALAAPPGRAARGIVRISGDDVRRILLNWFVPDQLDRWNHTSTAQSHTGTLTLDGETVHVAAQVLLWPTRRSYTGQPLIELHLPGSPCLLEAVLSEAYRHGARPARPGEFTMRAFLAGKLDLLQAEAVLGVIDAHDHRELQQALSQLAGGVSQQLAAFRRELLELLADLEAGLDFVDEDIEFVSRKEVSERLEAALVVVTELHRKAEDRMQARVRPRVVLAGLPNAGKSTLFNRLAGADAALVSDERGTTRDFLIHTITSGNFSFDLVDTAGWEDESTGIAAAAQSHRIEQLQQSDLLVWCSSATMNDAEKSTDDLLFQNTVGRRLSTIRLITKTDLVNDAAYSSERKPSSTINSNHLEPISISAVSNHGIARLLQCFQHHFGAGPASQSQWLGVTAARCRETLESVIAALDHAVRAARSREIGDELIAVDLRSAIEHLGVILGVIYTDDILDRIFSKFCIGK